MLPAGYKNLLPTLFSSCLMAMNKNSMDTVEVNIAETVCTAEQLVMQARFTNQFTENVFLEEFVRVLEEFVRVLEEFVRVLEFTNMLSDIPLQTISNIEFNDHEEQHTTNFGVSIVFVKTVFLGEEVVRILEFTSVFPRITLRYKDEDLELHAEISNVLTPIAIPDVFATDESKFLAEEGVLISECISESFDVSLEYIATVETTATEEHPVEYAIVMTDFCVTKETYAFTSFETVFTEEQTRC